jgi:SPX domain protein involved in polyphosphate accumulation
MEEEDQQAHAQEEEIATAFAHEVDKVNAFFTQRKGTIVKHMRLLEQQIQALRGDSITPGDGADIESVIEVLDGQDVRALRYTLWCYTVVTLLSHCR